MNSPAEIQQAMADYRRTGFGGWPWPADGPVHARDAGRFAKHADGHVEAARQRRLTLRSRGSRSSRRSPARPASAAADCASPRSAAARSRRSRCRGRRAASARGRPGRRASTRRGLRRERRGEVPANVSSQPTTSPGRGVGPREEDHRSRRGTRRLRGASRSVAGGGEAPGDPAIRRRRRARRARAPARASIVCTHPTPPISATKRPAGTSARCTPATTRSARFIQWRAALLNTASNSPSNGRASPSATRASSPRRFELPTKGALESTATTRHPRSTRDKTVRRSVAASEVEDPLARAAARGGRPPLGRGLTTKRAFFS